MDKPRFMLYLPAGTLAVMGPFKHWLYSQPTCQVVEARPGFPEDACDVVEFQTSIRWQFLRDTVAHLLARHCPYQLVVNLPDAPELQVGLRHFRITERGVVGQGPEWREIHPVTREEWAEAFKFGGARLGLFDVLARQYLSLAEIGLLRNPAR
jgi:hypothetical protein